jgi:hypothetical protein
MTLTTELTLVSYAGNGSTDDFAVTFPFWASGGLKVILVVDATGIETTQTETTHYSVTGGSGLTGTVTMVTPPASGETLIIKSDVDDTQETELPTGGKFPSATVEQRLDILTRLVQQKEEILGRIPQLKESTSLTSLVFPDPGALGYIRWNAAGTALETTSGVSSGTFIEDTDSDTKIQVEESADEDTIRFDALGVEVATMTSTAISMLVDLGVTGNITVSGTVDGRDVATDGAKLDLIEDNADVTDATNVDAAGAVMESDYINNAIRYKNSVGTMANVSFATNSVLVRQTGNIGNLPIGASELLGRASTGNVRNLTAAEVRTLINVEDGADVTDATNVNAAGAVMWSDLANVSLPYKNTVGGETNVTIADNTLVGRDASTGDSDVQGLTAAEVRTLINVADGAIANVVEDTSPQLGGNLDTNSSNIIFDTAHGIWDDANNDFLLFNKTTSAVNHIEITNAAIGNAPSITAAGNDAAVDLTLDGKGTGTVKTLSSNLDITGNIIVSGTVDGRDVATDGAKLDLIEANADVTDTVNVTAAGALMDSEVSSLSGIKTLTVPDSTTISTFGATLVDDADAGTARTTLDVQPTTNPSFVGTLDVTSTLTVSTSTLTSSTLTINPTGNAGIELGDQTGANTPFIDFHSSATSADYHARIIASGGTTIGTGTLTITAATLALGSTNLTTSGTIDGRDVATDGSKLDGIETTISAFGATLIDDAAASNARTTLGLVIGTDVMPELAVASLAQAQDGTSTTEYSWTPQRVHQAAEATPHFIAVQIEENTVDLAVATDKALIHVPFARKLTAVHAEVATAGTTGVTTFDINRNGTSMLSTKLTIDSGETGSDTAATAAVIDAAQDDTSVNDVITIDIDGVSTTAPKGAVITMTFENS